jgi:N4-gp56 family major capsid protein
MATTTYGVNDALTVKLWAKTLAVEALKETYIGRFIGTSPSSLIHMKTELSKGAGDRVTFGLRMQLNGDGVTEGQTLEGNEESLTTYSDNLLINELAHAVRVKNNGTIDAQRVPFNLREEAKDGLKDWFAGRIDQVFFNHLCGYTVVNSLASGIISQYSGNNTIIAPSTTRRLYGGSATTDQGLTTASTDSLTLALIDKAVEVAKTASPMIRPVRVNGEDMYVMFIHPSQTTSLRTSTTTGNWQDIQKAAMMGGQVSNNPIFKGSLGVYNNVILHESTRVTQGVHSSTGAAVANTRRAVLCGAQAAAIGYGQKFTGGENYNWVEELFDYERELGVSAQSVWGLKKTVFNSVDFGTIVLSTYAAPAA